MIDDDEEIGTLIPFEVRITLASGGHATQGLGPGGTPEQARALAAEWMESGRCTTVEAIDTRTGQPICTYTWDEIEQPPAEATWLDILTGSAELVTE